MADASHQLRRSPFSLFDPAHDSIKLTTLHVSIGLGFPVVALVGAGRMPAEGEDECEEARLPNSSQPTKVKGHTGRPPFGFPCKASLLLLQIFRPTVPS